jgi:hypothetical protein
MQINQNYIHEKNEEQIKFEDCLIPFSSESLAFSSSI